MFNDSVETILNELTATLLTVDNTEVDALIAEITSANKIVAVGAGRVGMATRGFAMRLAHLGFNTWMLGDATVPSIDKGDLLMASPGSGETQSIFDIVELAHKNGARIALITGNPSSRMGVLADTIVKLSAPSFTKEVGGRRSVQPMTTLNEQCLGIFFDSVVLGLMEKMGETHEGMWARHSNLE